MHHDAVGDVLEPVMTVEDRKKLDEADPLAPPDSSPNSKKLEQIGRSDSTDSRHLRDVPS